MCFFWNVDISIKKKEQEKKDFWNGRTGTKRPKCVEIPHLLNCFNKCSGRTGIIRTKCVNFPAIYPKHYLELFRRFFC